jgi:hypothetical protein
MKCQSYLINPIVAKVGGSGAYRSKPAGEQCVDGKALGIHGKPVPITYHEPVSISAGNTADRSFTILRKSCGIL